MSRLREFWSRLRGSRSTRVEAEGEPAGPIRPDSGRVPARLIVGLGNPGDQYVATRHNIGFRVVERLADRAGVGWRLDPGLDAQVARAEIAGLDCLLLAPQTFMNRSGTSVAAACARWPGLDPTSDLLVVYDDLDLPTGRIRLRPSGGAGGHRGIGDILERLDTRAVPRLRFGVGHPGTREGVLDWVLSPFPAEQARVVASSVEHAADAVEMALGEGLVAAMGQFNASP